MCAKVHCAKGTYGIFNRSVIQICVAVWANALLWRNRVKLVSKVWIKFVGAK